MRFTNEVVKDILIEHVHLSHATKEHAEEFKKFLLNDVRNHNKVLVDLTDCTFIDSTFISSLVTALKTINQKNGTIKILANNNEVHSVLELTGMAKVFDIFSDVDKAVENFS
jgi:anti-anti-sigma factor